MGGKGVWYVVVQTVLMLAALLAPVFGARSGSWPGAVVAVGGLLAVIPTVASLQQGLLVAVGVLLDTFLVRSLLIPALALDIGPATWWPYRPTSLDKE